MISEKERWFNIMSYVDDEYIAEANPLKQTEIRPLREMKSTKTAEQPAFGNRNRAAISVNKKRIFAIAASTVVLAAITSIALFLINKNNVSTSLQKPAEAIIYNQGDLMTDINGNTLCLNTITYKMTSDGATISLSGYVEFSNKIYNSTTGEVEYFQFNKNTVFLNYSLSSGEQGVLDFRADLFDSQTALAGGTVAFIFEMDAELAEKISEEIKNLNGDNALTLLFNDVMVLGNSTAYTTMQYQFLYKDILVE